MDISECIQITHIYFYFFTGLLIPLISKTCSARTNFRLIPLISKTCSARTNFTKLHPADLKDVLSQDQLPSCLLPKRNVLPYSNKSQSFNSEQTNKSTPHTNTSTSSEKWAIQGSISSSLVSETTQDGTRRSSTSPYQPSPWKKSKMTTTLHGIQSSHTRTIWTVALRTSLF